MSNATMPIASFKPDDLDCLRMFLADPAVFHLTKIERRACALAIVKAQRGDPVQGEDLAVVRRLLDADF